MVISFVLICFKHCEHKAEKNIPKHKAFIRSSTLSVKNTNKHCCLHSPFSHNYTLDEVTVAQCQAKNISEAVLTLKT